jgi:type II secretory pathway pseudopilin PulG
MKKTPEGPARLDSSFILYPSSFRSAFTLTEILIVIGLIVLLLGISVPAFNLIRGNRSSEGAQNQIAALLGRARADAIGLQKPYGIMFLMKDLSPGNAVHDGTVYIAEVYAADFPQPPAAAAQPNAQVYLDLDTNTEMLTLPAGVMAQTLNSTPTAVAGILDRYLGYNQFLQNGAVINPVVGSNLTTLYGGVILFGADGQLLSQTYGFRTQSGNPLVNTAMGDLLHVTGGANGFVDVGYNALLDPTSSLGFVLFDRESFKNGGDFTDSDPQLVNSPAGTEYTAGTGEEPWIDANSVPVLVNRYNGTLIRGE